MKIDNYLMLDNEIKENLEKRRVYAALFNDANLESEKDYFKSKIDLIDAKVACFLDCQSILIKSIF